MVFILPGPASVQVPAAIPGLRIAYSRNIETFHVNQMMQRISHDKVVGLYLRIDIDEGVRVVDAKTAANWPDNVVRPAAFEAKHEFETFRMARHSEAFQFGSLTLDQATWPIMQDRTAMAGRPKWRSGRNRCTSPIRAAAWPGKSSKPATSATISNTPCRHRSANSS